MGARGKQAQLAQANGSKFNLLLMLVAQMSTHPRVIATHCCSWGSRNFKLTHGALTAFEDLGVVAVALPRRARRCFSARLRRRCGPKPPLWGAGNRHFGSLRPASLRRHMRSAAPFSPQFCTCAPTAERRCPLGSVHAGEQPHRSRSATVSRSERSAQATRPPLAALATDLIASSISRPSASKLSMMDIVDREADAERPRGG